MLKWIYSIILEDIKTTQSIVSKVIDVLSDNHISVGYIFLIPLRNRKNRKVRKYAVKNQQAALELVKRVLSTRVENDAKRKISPFYEKEISGGNVAWSMSNNF